MNDILIRKLTANDIIQLQEISRKTFFETFSGVNTEEDMNKYLEDSLSLERLTTEFNTKDSEFYFALLDDTTIGYIKLNSGQAQTELKDDKALEIERIYVLREFHGQKVGQLLYEKAIEVAKQKDANYIWLGVWEENLKAIRFYKKNGFVEFDKHLFILGNDEQTDIMMKLELKS
jgi:ribosomal protein S18 acetylase RimI-like enzyme